MRGEVSEVAERSHAEVPERSGEVPAQILERFRSEIPEAKFRRGSGEVPERFWSEVPEKFWSEVPIGSEKVLE